LGVPSAGINDIANLLTVRAWDGRTPVECVDLREAYCEALHLSGGR
jgi:hypothetical protein